MTRDLPDRQGYLDAWSALHGGVDPRGSRFVHGWLSIAYAVAKPVARTGIHPDVVTLLGLVVSGLVVLLAWLGGWWLLAAAAVAPMSALVDSVDGAVAVMTGRTTAFGALLDAVVDRVSDVLLLLALWLVGAPAWGCVAAGVVVLVHEYARARATALGMSDVGVVTIGEKPTRVVVFSMFLLGAGLYQSAAAQWASVGAYASLAVGLIALAQLMVVVRRRLS